jgi:copper(I)-binding protein
MKLVIFISTLMFFTLSANGQSDAQNIAEAQDMAQRIIVDKVWARETFAMARSGAAYASFSNPSDADIVLVGAVIDETVASMVELHETNMVNGMMRMQELEDGLVIAPRKTVSMEPGGKHFMIMGLSGPLIAGNEFLLTLEFADGSTKALEVGIQDMSNRKADESTKPN